MDQLYGVVSEVDKYKEFIPWCTHSDIIQKRPGHFKCLMEIGFPPISERYISTVTVARPHMVKVSVTFRIRPKEHVQKSLKRFKM